MGMCIEIDKNEKFMKKIMPPHANDSDDFAKQKAELGL